MSKVCQKTIYGHAYMSQIFLICSRAKFQVILSHFHYFASTCQGDFLLEFYSFSIL